MTKRNIPGSSSPPKFDRDAVPEPPDSGETDCPLCEIYNGPNAKTLAAMCELDQGRGTKVYSSIEEMMRDLNTEPETTLPANGDDKSAGP